jgi:hypothetical protein
MKTDHEPYGGRLWPDGNPLPPPPRRDIRRVSWIWAAGGAVVVVGTIVAAVLVSASGKEPLRSAATVSSTPTSESPTAAAAPASSPAESDGESEPAPVVPDSTNEIVGSFNAANGWSVGTKLRFGVLWLRYPWPKCHTHTFSTGGKPRGAFYTDCAWDDQDLAFFQLNFKNRSVDSILLSRLNVTLRTRDGRELKPVDVGAVNKFLSKPKTLRWLSQWSAWVAFDNSAGDIHPASMSYKLGDETLTQTFDGSEAVVGPR